MTAPIDLLGGLKAALSVSDSGRGTVVLRTQGEILFDPDDKLLANALSQAAVAQVRDMLRKGKRADGTPLQPLDPDTLEWRVREAAQGARGGAAAPQYKDPIYRANVLLTYHRDYTPAKGKTVYSPKAGGSRGIVSRILHDSFAARAAKDGKGFVVFCAAIRGKPRPGEDKSALESVFAGAPVVGRRPMQAPEMKKAAAQGLRDAIGSKAKLARRKADLLRELMRLAQNVGDLAE